MNHCIEYPQYASKKHYRLRRFSVIIINATDIMLKRNDKKVKYYKSFTGKGNEIPLLFILPRFFPLELIKSMTLTAEL